LFFERTVVPEAFEEEVGLLHETDVAPDRHRALEPQRFFESLVTCFRGKVRKQVLNQLFEGFYLANPEPGNNVPEENVIVGTLQEFPVLVPDEFRESAMFEIVIKDCKDFGFLCGGDRFVSDLSEREEFGK
jgi:hypothetical protein